MSQLVTVGLAGFAASLVDGALGMGFGLTSSSILLTSGIAPAAAAATVNIAKVATGFVSGVSHWKLRNIDRQIVVRLAIPGAFGALIGTTVLTNVDADTLRPILAALLLLLGVRILVRFSAPLRSRPAGDGVDREQLRGVAAAGVAGGVTNGLIGAWGPVVTPFLLHRRVAPRIVVGSVNTAEVAVAFVAAGSLLTTHPDGLKASTVAAMLIGGTLAAPLAAWSVRLFPPRVLGLLVAGLLLVTNARDLARWAEVGSARWLAYAAILALVALAGARPRLQGLGTMAPAGLTSAG